jgi:outer membrane protein assembly factor BamE
MIRGSLWTRVNPLSTAETGMTSRVKVLRNPRVNRNVAVKAASVLAMALLTGCVYRLDIQQGNVIEMESVEQVQVGMTRSQVQFLLGTPTISDTFHDNRWDYPYYFRQGRQRSVERRWFVVFFEEDRVARVVHEIPEGSASGSPAS